MADNLTITEGTGTTVATDQVGTDHYQKVKLVDGTADSSTIIAVNVGVKANALRVAPANDITDATYIGDIRFAEGLPTNSGVDIGDVDVTSIVPGTAATNLGKARDSALGATDTGVMALAIRDDTLTTLTPADGDYAPLRVNSTGALHVTGGGGGTQYAEDAAHSSGATGTLALTVRQDTAAQLAGTDADYSVLITDASGRLHVNVGALPASTNTIEVVGDVAENANAAGNPVLIGGRYDSSPRTLGDTDVGAIALAVDGAVHIDDGGNTITVDGTITANLSSTDNTVLDNIDSNTDYGAVVGGGAESTALRVTIANDSTGIVSIDDNASSLTVDQGTASNLKCEEASASAIKDAVEIMDDWDATHDSAVSVDGPQLMAAYDSTKPTAVDSDADAVRVLADAYGRLLAGVEPERFQATITSADAQSATQVKAKTGGKKMYILTLIVSTDTAMNIQFQDDTGPTVLVEQLYLAANGGAVIPFPPEAPLVVNTNEDFDVIASTAGNISVTITGYLAP